MKQIILTALLLSCIAGAAMAQEQKPAEPSKDSLQYKLYPALPAFNIRMMDSFNVFNTFNIPKGRPSVLILFDPDCKHCKAMTKILLAGMDSLKNIDFYWVTPAHSMTMLREFYKDNNLEDYKNIKIVGRDYEFFCADFFNVHYVPDIALYDKNKQFVHLWEGGVKVQELYEYTHR